MSYTNADIVPAALAGKDAETSTGNMSTRNVIGGGMTFGHLPESFYSLVRSRRAHITQVIYSYSTPIAWLDDEHGWIIPNVSYSITTSSKHQTHLYRLRGRHITLAWDATPEDAQRVLDGIMIFTTDNRGHVNGIKAA